MAWFNLHKVEQDTNDYRDPTAREWLEAGNKYEPKEGKKYDWVWEYAQFQFSVAENNRRSTEEKSVTILKFAASLAAFAWAVLVFLDPLSDVYQRTMRVSARHEVFTFLNFRAVSFIRGTEYIVGATLVCLFLSALFAMLAFKPTIYFRPLDEKKALDYADSCPNEQYALAKFLFGLAGSSADRRKITAKKMKLLFCATVLLTIAVALFTLLAAGVLVFL
ncbi:MAG: hypothetical protein ACRD1I_00015 [Terriglobia bacterium]